MCVQVIIRKVEVCKKCGAHNSFRKYGIKIRGIYYAKCKECGQAAAIRELLLDSNNAP
jgi:uncharacterized Zn finger protein